MSYLDKEEKFYDYRTKPFDGSNPFDTTKTGISYYNQFFTDPDYMEDVKERIGKIEYLTPKEYFEQSSIIFGNSYQNQINQIKEDNNIIQHLKDVLFKYKKTFPITYLNYADCSQEGRHRMFVVGEELGWDKKFPVLIVRDANNRNSQIQKLSSESYKNALKEQIYNAIHDYAKTSPTLEQFKSNIINHLKRGIPRSEIIFDNENIIVKVDDLEVVQPLLELNIPDNIDIDDLTSEDIELLPEWMK